MPATAMELYSLPLVLLLCLLAGSSTTTLPRIDRVRQQVDGANRRVPSVGLRRVPSVGLVMSYVGAPGLQLLQAL